MNSIDYFSPEELASLRGGASGASAATGDRTAADISAAYQKAKAALAAQRTAPSVSSPAQAAAPAAETIAPAATAEAASSPTLGQRIINARSTLSNIGNVAARGLGAAQALTGAVQGNTSSSADNTFNGVATILSPGIGVAGNILSGVRNAVLSHVINSRSAGPNNIGPELQKQIDSAGGLDNLLKQQTAQPRTLPTVASPPPSAAPAAAPASVQAPAQLTDIPSGIPQSGTGYFKNESTGDVTRVGTPDGTSNVGSSAPASAPAARGGVFSSLLFPFLNQYSSQALGTAQQAREYKHQQTQQERGIEQKYKEGMVGAAQDTAAAHKLSATAAYLGATAKENPIKIVQDALGNPIVVNASNPNNITATKPTPQQVPTLQEFMRQAKLLPGNSERSDAELAQYYKHRYGG